MSAVSSLQGPHAFKGRITVAASTVRAEFAVVHVIGAMTVDTAITRLFHRCKRATVTVVARDIQVGAIQCEAGLYVVIKQPQVPGDRVVAGIALIVKLAAVGIVFKMAADTLRLGLREHLALVTLGTLGVVVLAE